MKPERLEALLWERIDGVISVEENAELAIYLAGHREARDLEREITALAERMENMAELAEPEELRA